MRSRMFDRITALWPTTLKARYRRDLIAAIGKRVANLHGAPAADPPWKTDDTAALEAILWALRPDATAPEGQTTPGGFPDEAAVPAAPRSADHPPAIVESLVRIADWLAETAAAPPGDSARLVKRMRWSLHELMEQCDVSLIVEEGPVRTPEHEVIAVKPTGDPALVHHIAETLRPGVHWRGRMVRAQQVVAYVDDGSAARR